MGLPGTRLENMIPGKPLKSLVPHPQRDTSCPFGMASSSSNRVGYHPCPLYIYFSHIGAMFLPESKDFDTGNRPNYDPSHRNIGNPYPSLAPKRAERSGAVALSNPTRLPPFRLNLTPRDIKKALPGPKRRRLQPPKRGF